MRALKAVHLVPQLLLKWESKLQLHSVAAKWKGGGLECSLRKRLMHL